MKLVTFTGPEPGARIGALAGENDTVVDLAVGNEALKGGPNPVFADMLSLIEGGPGALEDARRIDEAVMRDGIAEAQRDLGSVSLLAPVPRPLQMRDCLAFEKHFVQARQARYRKLAAAAPDPEAAWREFEESGVMAVPDVWYAQPLYYKQNRLSVVGPETDVVWPRYSTVMDFELELGIFIGKTGKNITRERAAEHIFGYTIFNDFSARDAQAREMAGQLGPAKGKDFDTGNVIGPWLVTADEIADPYDLTMVARVNGEEWSRGKSGEMHHRFEDMIAHISADETLFAGEFIGSGTVGGGCGLELGRFLADGNVVELEIEGLGILRNRVRAQS
jgi:2-keto-4-pentenoate hydratase/2-oxohepta-3-ene-1,7-dioic acid hydratase in catechol pathway